MKFLHIADLHLGKRLNDVNLLEDQIHILRQISDIAEAEAVDGILIAGDIYQQSAPSSEAVTVFSNFVCRMVKSGIKVFAVSGNHDSDQRVSYFSPLVRQAGVYISEKFEGTLQQFTLQDEYGDITVSLLPFLRPIHARKCFPEGTVNTTQEAMAAVLAHSNLDTSKRNILLCHQFVTGAQTSDSEEHSLGGLDNVDAALFDAFDYVALGHIHRPQKMGRDTLRYAGSPLKYSLSEANQKKSVTLVTVGKKGNVSVTEKPLTPLHDVREVEGFLPDIMKMPYSEDYVRVTVHDEIVAPDAKVTVATVFPNMMKFAVSNSKTKVDIDVLAKAEMENKTVTEMFIDFFRLQSDGTDPDKELLEAFKQILKESEDESHETR